MTHINLLTKKVVVSDVEEWALVRYVLLNNMLVRWQHLPFFVFVGWTVHRKMNIVYNQTERSVATYQMDGGYDCASGTNRYRRSTYPWKQRRFENGEKFYPIELY